MTKLKFILTYNGGTTTLNYSPEGWDETLVRWERSVKYLGLFRSFTVKLKFVKEGAALLRQAFYTEGPGAEVSVTIQRLDKISLEYYTAYQAEVDFATFKDSANYVEVSLAEGGLSKLIKENEGDERHFITIDPATHNGTGFPISTGSGTVIACNLIDIFRSIINIITDGGITSGSYAVKSDLLESKQDFIVLVNSRKNYLHEHFEIKTSLKDFFKSVNALFGIGMGIEVINNKETLVLEQRAHFFDSTSIIHSFNDVADFELSVKDDLIFNNIKLGYPEQDYDEADPSHEPNTYSIFKPNKPNGVVSELDITSKYRGDYTGLIELLEDPEQDSNDWEIFFAEVYDMLPPVGLVPVAGLIRNGGSGDEFPLFNSNLTPHKLLDAHRTFIESCLYGTPSIKFVSGGNNIFNNEVNAYPNQGWVAESQGVDLNPPSLFLPYTISITVPLVDDLNNIITRSSTGVVAFDWRGNSYKGYIFDCKVKLAGRGETQFKLLAAHDNDLSTLIR